MDDIHQAVTLVMRTLGNRPREIRRALASVVANTWRPLEVIVVCQGAEGEGWADIQRLPAEFAPLSVCTLRNAHPGDRRAENLNIGWAAGRGRFVGFLDDDDTLEPEHVRLLVEAMAPDRRAWAYAQTVLRKENEALGIVSETRPFQRQRFSLQDLWTENFLPIHSILIDRSRLVPDLQQRPFCENLDRGEDWDFLLRLAYHHRPAVIELFTCAYHVSTGSRNTNQSLMESGIDPEREQRNREAWARCKVLVEERRSKLLAQPWWAREYLEPVPPPRPAVETAGGATPVFLAPLSALRHRAVRKLIRLLEKLL